MGKKEGYIIKLLLKKGSVMTGKERDREYSLCFKKFEKMSKDTLVQCKSCILQAMSELRHLLSAYKTEIGSTPNILGVALSARKNLCIHPSVKWACVYNMWLP